MELVILLYTGSSGNGDGAGSGDNLSIERLRVDSSGLFYVNTTSANNWSQTSNSLNTDNSNGSNPDLVYVFQNVSRSIGYRQ